MTTAQTAARPALVVEDEEDARRYFVHCLQYLGFAVDTADNGMSALEMAAATDYDVIVCDVRLPKLSGTSFLANLVKRVPSAERRIVVVSSLDDSSVKRDALAAGACAYLVKPVTLDMLRQTLAADAVPG